MKITTLTALGLVSYLSVIGASIVKIAYPTAGFERDLFILIICVSAMVFVLGLGMDINRSKEKKNYGKTELP